MYSCCSLVSAPRIMFNRMSSSPDFIIWSAMWMKSTENGMMLFVKYDNSFTTIRRLFSCPCPTPDQTTSLLSRLSSPLAVKSLRNAKQL